MKRLLHSFFIFLIICLTACGSDDYFDVDFRNMELPGVQKKINGTWEMVKKTSGVPGTDDEIDIGQNTSDNLCFEEGKVAFINPASSMSSPMLTVEWQKTETAWGEKAWRITIPESTDVPYLFIIGIHNKKLVTSQLIRGEIINTYYSRTNY